MNPNLDPQHSSGIAGDKEFENSIRPGSLEEFSGQPGIIENLKVFIKAAQLRGESLDHVLFHGPRDWEKQLCRELLPGKWGPA